MLSRDAQGPSLIANGSFENIGSSWLSPWYMQTKTGGAATVSQTNATRADGSYSALLNVTAASAAQPWVVQLSQDKLAITNGQTYTVAFSAKAAAGRTLDAVLQQTASPYAVYAENRFSLTTAWQTFSFSYPAGVSDPNVSLHFNVGGATGNVWIDAVSVAAGNPTATPSPAATPTPTRTATLTPTRTPAAVPTTASVSLLPASDATVRADSPSTNYGSATTLTSDGSPITAADRKVGLTGLGSASIKTSTPTRPPTSTPTPTRTPTASPSPAPAVTASSPGGKGVALRPFVQYWGSNRAGMDSDFADMKAGGITWARIDLFNTASPDPNFDYAVQSAKSHGINVLITVHKTPPETDLGTDADRAVYRTWLGQMVDRYKYHVKYWAIHNEPNLHYEWNIDDNDGSNQAAYEASVARYVLHLRDGYETVKAKDPTAKVLFAGLSEWTVERYMDALIKTDAYRYFDIMPFHPYGRNPDRVLSRFNSFKGKMTLNSNYSRKPIWVTEIGFNTYWSNKAGYVTSEQKNES